MTPSFEEFTPEQEALLGHFVTNTRSSIFALYNIPEVIKGALFSRYSRSTLGLRSLLLKEFLLNQEEAGVKSLLENLPSSSQEQLLSIKKAQNFYDRILDGYGDDSIGELGGAHLALENISIIAAKVIEDCRIGGSPLEKSTRYVYFDQKVNGEYLFHKEAVLMTSAWKSLYVNTCNMLFDTYSRLIPPLTTFMMEKYPKEADVSKGAYAAAIRAKVLDCLRGLLPASTLTNMGVFGNGRFFEGMLHKLHNQNLSELRDIGKASYDELEKIIPSFVRRAEISHKTHVDYADFQEAMRTEIKEQAKVVVASEDEVKPGATLVASDPEAVFKVAAALLYQETNQSFDTLLAYCKTLSHEALGKLLDTAAVHRENRRQRSPRALENAVFTFDLVADFGAYRDLQRHRLVTQERQLLTCKYGYYIPEELQESGLDRDYIEAMDAAKQAYDTIANQLPEEAQYVVPMAYNIRWYFTTNLREIQWITELRSQPSGHACYRVIAQQMAKVVGQAVPEFSRFLKFVDYDSYHMGRLGAEVRLEQKRQGAV
jgi:thymidylate synthase ThyX